MSEVPATYNTGHLLEQVVIQGDLAKLSPTDRVSYYGSVCESIGLNPLTKPFEYIVLNGRLTLYARKDCTDQLRKINQVSIDPPRVDYLEGMVIVTVTARDKTGRTDSDMGVVAIEGLKGDARANAIMKSITKAKRRVTLSICGLGMLDETEIETIPDARPAPMEILNEPIAKPAQVAKSAAPANTNGGTAKRAPTRLELLSRYDTLAVEARTLGIQVNDLPDNVTEQEIVRHGQALTRQVQAAKAKAGVQNGK